MKSITIRQLQSATRKWVRQVSTMSTVQEIESAIDRLGDEEVAELRAWLFDRDIARDAACGKLDSLAEEALREARAGHTKPL